MKSFKDIKLGDTLYYIKSNHIYRSGTGPSNFDVTNLYIEHNIVEQIVTSIKLVTSETTSNTLPYDICESKPEEIQVYKIYISFNTGKSICVNLTNSDTYLYNFANVYVNKTEAEDFIKNYYKKVIEITEKDKQWLNYKLVKLQELLNEYGD